VPFVVMGGRFSSDRMVVWSTYESCVYHH